MSASPNGDIGQSQGQRLPLGIAEARQAEIDRQSPARLRSLARDLDQVLPGAAARDEDVDTVVPTQLGTRLEPAAEILRHGLRLADRRRLHPSRIRVLLVLLLDLERHVIGDGVRCGMKSRASRSSRGSRTCWVSSGADRQATRTSRAARRPRRANAAAGRRRPRSSRAPERRLRRPWRAPSCSRNRSTSSSSSGVTSNTYSLMKHWRASAQQKRNRPSLGGCRRPLARGIEQDRAHAGETAAQARRRTPARFRAMTRNSSSSAIAARRPDKSSIVIRVGHAAAARAQPSMIAGFELDQAHRRNGEVGRPVPRLRQRPQHQRANAERHRR